MMYLNFFLSILDTEILLLILQVYLPARVLRYDELYIQLTNHSVMPRFPNWLLEGTQFIAKISLFILY